MITGFDRYRFAQAHLDAGEPLEALAMLRPLEDELAGHAAGLLLLGRGYYHSAQLERAQRAFERVVELDPSDAHARFLLGRTLERRSRPAEALVHYRLATAMSDHPDYRDRLELVAARLKGTPSATTG
jgi:cytochrome c-type biogenesis protein CcmH/NrfG